MMPRFQPGDYDDFGNTDPGRPEDAPAPPDDRPRVGARSGRASGMAVASLICGVMFCVTPIPGLCAIIFGAIGLRETRDRSVSGRGFAITGMILGLVGTACWLVVGACLFLFANFLTTEKSKAEVMCKAFLQDLADGKIDAAIDLSVPGIDRKPLEEASAAMRPWGPLNSLVGRYNPIATRRGDLHWKVDADAVFSRGGCDVMIELMKDGTNYRIEHFNWQKHP